MLQNRWIQWAGLAVGGLLLVLLPTFVNRFTVFILYLMITGVIFILVIRFMPTCIWGWLRHSKIVGQVGKKGAVGN